MDFTRSQEERIDTVELDAKWVIKPGDRRGKNRVVCCVDIEPGFLRSIPTKRALFSGKSAEHIEEWVEPDNKEE